VQQAASQQNQFTLPVQDNLNNNETHARHQQQNLTSGGLHI
jgi:hypothetical protein